MSLLRSKMNTATAHTATASLAESPLDCGICNKAFSSKDSLRVHKTKYHSKQSSERIRQLLEECIRLLDPKQEYNFEKCNVNIVKKKVKTIFKKVVLLLY